MTTSIALVIVVTSVATYLSRFLGVLSSEKIKETSKAFTISFRGTLPKHK